MTKEDYFLQAEINIFGQPPACPLALIGHNMAISYLTPLIWEAEPVLRNPIARPPAHFITQMEKAFVFSSYGALRNLPKESMAALQECTESFRKRYEPLVEGLSRCALFASRKNITFYGRRKTNDNL